MEKQASGQARRREGEAVEQVAEKDGGDENLLVKRRGARPWRHGGTRRANGGARPSLARHTSPQRQHHHGEAHGHGTRSVGGDEIASAHHGRRAEAMGTSRGSGETQIGAVDLKRRRTAVQTHPILPAAMAGVGRRNSAKAAATRESPEREELGFRERE